MFIAKNMPINMEWNLGNIGSATTRIYRYFQSLYIKDDSKCILCGKCVRTCYELEERQVLSFANRGFNTRIVLDTDKNFETSKCVSCNRCVSLPCRSINRQKTVK